MKNGAESCGHGNDRMAKDVSPDGGARLELGTGAARARDAESLHRGRTRVGAKDEASPGADFGAGKLVGNSAGALESLGGSGSGGAGEMAPDLARLPDGVRASVASKPGEYDARRLRSQREIIRDVMISAADCETWLTLGELRALTRYGEASISAQLRHLRKTENGGYEVEKRHREGVCRRGLPGTDGRGECVWEYRITRGMCGDRARFEAQLEAVGA
jgi:hypothetical protein